MCLSNGSPVAEINKSNRLNYKSKSQVKIVSKCEKNKTLIRAVSIFDLASRFNRIDFHFRSHFQQGFRHCHGQTAIHALCIWHFTVEQFDLPCSKSWFRFNLMTYISNYWWAILCLFAERWNRCARVCVCWRSSSSGRFLFRFCWLAFSI